MKALDSYETEYERWENVKHTGSHWDSNLCMRMKDERFKLSPKDEVSASILMETWIDALIFDIIKFDTKSGNYQIKSIAMGGSYFDDWFVNMGATRKKAFRYLEDNIDVLGDEIGKRIHEMDVPGPDNPIRLLTEKAIRACQDGSYLQAVSKCPIAYEDIKLYEDEADMIQKEVLYILNNKK